MRGPPAIGPMGEARSNASSARRSYLAHEPSARELARSRSWVAMILGRERERELDGLLGGLREVQLRDLRFLEVLAVVRDIANARRPPAGPFEDHRRLELVRDGELVQRADPAGDHDHRVRRADREGVAHPA